MKKLRFVIFIIFLIALIVVVGEFHFSHPVYGGIFHRKLDTSMSIQNTVIIDEIPKEIETQRTNFSTQNKNTAKNSQKSTAGEYFTTYHSTNDNNTVKKDIYKMKRDVKYALSDENKKLLTNAVYDGFTIFDNQKGLYLTKRNGKSGLINYKGKIIVPTKYETIEKTLNENYVLIKNRKYTGLYDLKNSKVVIPVIYSSVIPLDENNFILKLNEKFGFVHYGKFLPSLIKPKYSNYEKYKMVYKTYFGDKIGLVSAKNCELITEPLYDEIVLLDEHRTKKDEVAIFKTRIENRYGLIYYRDKSSIIIQPIYEDVQNKGHINVLANGYWRILDNHGNIKTKPQGAF